MFNLRLTDSQFGVLLESSARKQLSLTNRDDCVSVICFPVVDTDVYRIHVGVENAVAEMDICPHDDALIVRFEGLEPVRIGQAGLLTHFEDWVRLSFRYHAASGSYAYEPYGYYGYLNLRP